MEPEIRGHAKEVILERLWSIPLLKHFQKVVCCAYPYLKTL
jgi:hypothetical protein